MLRDGKRSCDVCYHAISNGDKYITRKIFKEQLPLMALGELLTVDSYGNVQMDICMDCASITGVSGEVE